MFSPFSQCTATKRLVAAATSAALAASLAGVVTASPAIAQDNPEPPVATQPDTGSAESSAKSSVDFGDFGTSILDQSSAFNPLYGSTQAIWPQESRQSIWTAMVASGFFRVLLVLALPAAVLGGAYAVQQGWLR